MKLNLRPLESERLFLRNARASDQEALFRIMNEETTLKYNCLTHVTMDEVREYIKRCEQNPHKYFLEDKETQEVIGEIALDTDYLRYGVNSLSISYYLDASYMRKGFMSEALSCVIDYLFETTPLMCISARVFVANIASNALLRKLGFQLEGTLKQAVRGYQNIIYDDNLYVLFRKESAE